MQSVGTIVSTTKKKKPRCRSDNGAFYLIDEDCRPAGDDAGTGAALNPRKLKRASRRACCFCTLRLRLKQAWSQVLGTKKPQACAWGFLGLEVRSGFEPL